MIWFFIKKNFFDGWENIINILIPNLLTIGLLLAGAAGFCFIYMANPLAVFLIYLMCLVIIALIIVFVSAFAKNALAIANFETATLGGYFSEIGNAFKENIKFAFMVSFIIVSAVIGVPLYINMNSFYGVMLGMILLFFAILMMLAFQWYIPLKVLLGGDFKKTIKKCFIILFDNFGFSIFMALYSIVLTALSVFLLLTLPGFNGVLQAQVNALRLRMYKYDWLDQHPDRKSEKKRKSIPWEALLKEDEAVLGKKSIKSLFMPWKAEHED